MASLVGFITLVALVPVVMTVLPRLTALMTPTGPVSWYKTPLGWMGIAIVFSIVILGVWLANPSKETFSLLLGFGVLLGLSALAFFGKGGISAKLGLAVLALCLLLFGARTTEVLEKVQGAATGVVLETKKASLDAPESTQPQTTRNEAKWERLADGSFPVGVWSEKVTVFPGCEIIHASGCGTTYALQYRKGNSGWIDQSCKTTAESDELRIKFLTPGNKDFPMKEKCS